MPRNNLLPQILPFLLGDSASLYASELKRSCHTAFRRFQMKRRSTDGEYETDWQTIEESRIMKYGTTQWKIDDVKLNFFDQSGLTVDMDNSDGFFSSEEYAASFWSGYLSQYRTLCRVQAGYLVGDDEATQQEVPSQTTIFTGIMTEDPIETRDMKVSFKFNALTSVMDEVQASLLNLNVRPTSTAEHTVKAIRDFTDANSVAVFQKFITSGAWNIQSTSVGYPSLNTSTSVEDETCLSLMKKLADAERYIFFVSGDGSLHFRDRTPLTSTVAYTFFGGSRALEGQAHTLIRVNSYVPARSKVYNRIRIKFNDANTTTSYYTKQEDWTWGDNSSSFVFGVKTLSLENLWLNTAGAMALGDALYSEYRELKREINFDAKFMPNLTLLDRITVNFSNYNEDVNLWGSVAWDKSIWSPFSAHHLEIRNKTFSIINLSHNIDKFMTSIKAREI